MEHISFDTLKKQEEIPETLMEEVQEKIEGIIQAEDYQETKVYGFCTPIQMIKRFSADSSRQRKMIQIIFFGWQRTFLLYSWTGEGFSLIPP